MATIICRSLIVLVLLLYLDHTKCEGIERTLDKLDQLLQDATSFRRSRDSDDISPVWQEYEFDTGAGNREELVVTNITISQYAALPGAEISWQFLEANGYDYLARADTSTLSFYKLNYDDVLMDSPVNLEVDGDILTFKIIALKSSEPEKFNIESDIVAVLCVESYNGTSLRWYRLSENYFRFFSSWPVQKHIKDLEFIQHGNQNKLLLLDDNEMHFGKQYSSVDVYGFSVDFLRNDFKFWLHQRTLLPKTFDIQVCTIYESISLAFQGASDIFLYEYRESTTTGGIFREMQTIRSRDVKNFVCFESGYIQYLATSGPEARIFNFFENEFQYNSESESSFEVDEISWVRDIRLNTFRDESLLLIQLRNSTVIALAWQGLAFKRILLPNKDLDRFDLSKVSVIPKFGFVSGNEFVKFDTKLNNLRRPTHDETEGMLATQALLNVVLQEQESIINETISRIENSYLKNSVITGFWNVSILNATNATVGDNVTYNSVSIGSSYLTIEDLKSDLSLYAKKLEELENRLDEIHLNLKNTTPFNSKNISPDSEITVFENLNITGTLNVKNLTVNLINEMPLTHVLSDLKISLNDSTTKFTNFSISSLNGIPITNILFDSSKKDFTGLDFSKINELVIDGDLSFSRINDITWADVMQNVVRKDKPAIIPGDTVIKGAIIADEVNVDNINNLRYPDDYVPRNSTGYVNVTGAKTFDKLTITNLLDINTINGEDIENFVILNQDNVLQEEITFENLIVEGPLQIDGPLNGMNSNKAVNLNESLEISSNIVFTNLTVFGNIILEESIGSKNWSNFNNLLLKTDNNVEISGTKTFLNEVEINSTVKINLGLINGHHFDEFVTLDTEQELPNLEKISANVSFGQVTFEDLKKLEHILTESSDSKSCLQKIILFKSPITVDDLSFDTLKSNISQEHLFQRQNESFKEVYLENLTVTTLIADEIVPESVNGVNFTKFIDSLATQHVIENYTTDSLEISKLHAMFINGISLDELNLLKDHVERLYEQVITGNISVESLQVTGTINATSINGEIFEHLHRKDRMGTVIFERDVSIENLTVLGLMNGLNFTEFASDAILKTDRNIVITGYKNFDKIYCERLETTSLNGHPVENILNPSKEQVLTGPIIVNGSVNVLKEFDVKGKIGAVSFSDLMKRFHLLDNNTYKLYGDFLFSDNVSITNLYANGSIHAVPLDNFLASLIFKDQVNVSICGRKVFKNSITFNSALTVRDRLNDLDLKRFYENAVFIDQPFSIRSKIVFKENVTIEKDLILRNNLQANSIMNVNMNDLQENVIYLDRPTSVLDLMEFVDVTFRSDVQAKKINDLNMQLLIPLHVEQMIPVQLLKCRNVTVKKITSSGRINGQDLNTIYDNTLMLFGEQNITGNIIFHGKVYAGRDFDARLINGIDPRQMIPLHTKETLFGNFVFKKSVILNQSLRVLRHVNDININRWQAVAVTTSFPLKQIISGEWTVHGNVYLENGSFGNNILDGVNVEQLSEVMTQKRLEEDAIVRETSMNLESICKDLNVLKTYAESQIYKFNTFDYLQILKFHKNIVSMHYFELEGLDYLLISYDTCHMSALLFTGAKFVVVANVSGFGAIDRWTTFYADKALYFLTIGKNSCERSSGNLWKLENDEFTHVLDLGNVTDTKEITQATFRNLISQDTGERSLEEENIKVQEPFLSSHEDDILQRSLSTDRKLLNNRESICEYARYFKNTEVLMFRAGIYEKEMFLYYNEEISEDYIFICNNDEGQKKIVQTIKAHRPSSFSVLNFDGLLETLIVFTENGNSLKVYEYKGIQGFVYRDSIRIEVEKLFSFKIRKYPHLAKRHCLGLINKNQLTILEAKMYGEKLDMTELSCSNY